jgi:phospholipid transport system substrate-binding protein
MLMTPRIFPHIAGLWTAMAAGLSCLVLPIPALARPVAETFIADNVHQGLDILGNANFTISQRDDQFKVFLLGLTDMKRVALCTLGPYASKATVQDGDAFAKAFQEYALDVYRSYFSKYAGQTLTITGSSAHGADDFVVATILVDPTDRGGSAPLQVDFRVKTDGARPILVDLSVAGIWVALEERDQFVAFLDHNNGDIPLLISHLHGLALAAH